MSSGSQTRFIPALEQTFVALDLETTGLHPDRDRIIQVGAVKFQGDRVLERFDTMVNPGRQIPDVIQRLTGIRPEQVRRAPSFDRISHDLRNFLADHPIVGHNIMFDLRFLEQEGLPLTNASYDTWDLAYVFLPRANEYSLAALVRHFGLEQRRAHQAIDDADAARQLFVTLLRQAADRHPALLEHLRRLARRREWHFGNLLAGLGVASSEPAANSIFGADGLELSRMAARLGSPESRRASAGLSQMDESSLTRLIGSGGPFARFFAGFEARPQQEEMLASVAQTIYQGGQLIVEGGTGVGKSMAYLLPAALFAAAQRKLIVISTNTINLQEQLIKKDIPAVVQTLEKTGALEPGLLQATILKGRSNYLCLHRWNYLAGSDSAPEDQARAAEARLLSKTAVWLEDSAAGDRSEINLSWDGNNWAKISAGERNWCPALYSGGSPCFLRGARERAEQAHILVVNHALLLSDLAMGGGVIPEYQHLIIDEAHNLEDEATRQFSFQVGPNWLPDELEQLRRLNREIRTALSAPLVATAMRQAGEAALAAVEETAPRLRRNWGEMWQAAETFFRNQRNNDNETDLLITPAARGQRSWEDLETAGENVAVGLDELIRGLETLGGFLVNVDGITPSAPADNPRGPLVLRMETGNLADSFQTLRNNLSSILPGDDPDKIQWLHRDTGKGEVSFHSAPLEIGQLLHDRLFTRKESVILTSATLSAEGSFNYARRRLGLPEETREKLVGSPFDYPRAALLLTPEDMPQPQAPDYNRAVANALAQLGSAISGHTMALFTSYASLRSVHNLLQNDARVSGIEVLAQGIHGSPPQLARRFIENPGSILLGASSFWEGVDFPGGVLKALVITRLPFPVPADPIVKARSEQYQNPFYEYSIPQAILRFRQGMGRLIRSKGDRGVIVVLDQRITARSYGRNFLTSIPDCTRLPATIGSLPRLATEWLASRSGRR